MKKFAVAAVIPIFASFLWAQTEQTRTERTETTTTNNNTWNGTLVDAGCRSTHTEHSTSSTSNPDANTTRTETTHSTSDSSECPVTTSTTTFGLLTSDGKFVRFDNPSNTKIIEMVKSNRAWKREMEGKKPVTVRVVGTANGDTIVLESIK